MIHNLVHNTLFKGACKYKDLDHFLGKKHTLSEYLLLDNLDVIFKE